MEAVFEQLRHLLAPFGWDVAMERTPAPRVTRFYFTLEVRAAGHALEGQRIGFERLLHDSEVKNRGDWYLRDLPRSLAREVIDEATKLLLHTEPARAT